MTRRRQRNPDLAPPSPPADDGSLPGWDVNPGLSYCGQCRRMFSGDLTCMCPRPDKPPVKHLVLRYREDGSLELVSAEYVH